MLAGEVRNNADSGEQSCTNPSSSSCDQTCQNNVCILNCHSKHCDQRCYASDCSLQCDGSNYCIQYCSGSKCSLKCHAHHCDQTCYSSSCTLECDSQTCNQTCNNMNDCTKFTVSRATTSRMKTVTTEASPTTTGHRHISGLSCTGE